MTNSDISKILWSTWAQMYVMVLYDSGNHMKSMCEACDLPLNYHN